MSSLILRVLRQSFRCACRYRICAFIHLLLCTVEPITSLLSLMIHLPPQCLGLDTLAAVRQRLPALCADDRGKLLGNIAAQPKMKDNALRAPLVALLVRRPCSVCLVAVCLWYSYFVVCVTPMSSLCTRVCGMCACGMRACVSLLCLVCVLPASVSCLTPFSGASGAEGDGG